MESVYRVDLKRADQDPRLLDGDDEGCEGTAGRSSACVAPIHHGKGCQKAIHHGKGYQKAIQHGLNVKTTITLGRTNSSKIDTRTDSA